MSRTRLPALDRILWHEPQAQLPARRQLPVGSCTFPRNTALASSFIFSNMGGKQWQLRRSWCTCPDVGLVQQQRHLPLGHRLQTTPVHGHSAHDMQWHVKGERGVGRTGSRSGSRPLEKGTVVGTYSLTCLNEVLQTAHGLSAQGTRPTLCFGPSGSERGAQSTISGV